MNLLFSGRWGSSGYFAFMEKGDFILYRNAERNFEVISVPKGEDSQVSDWFACNCFFMSICFPCCADVPR